MTASATPGRGRLQALERDGIAIIPGFISGERLAAMQAAFRLALQHLKVNTTPGYEKTEPQQEVVQVRGPAGTGCLFDTSGVHPQGVPILAPRHAIFLNYHGSRYPPQPSDIKGDRYYPLLLNAAVLGDRTSEEFRLLGFRDKTNYRPGYVRPARFQRMQRSYAWQLATSLRVAEFGARVTGKLKRLVGG